VQQNGVFRGLFGATASGLFLQCRSGPLGTDCTTTVHAFHGSQANGPNRIFT
jgi:hypothetical protein